MEITESIIKEIEQTGGEALERLKEYKESASVWDSCTDRYQFVETESGDILHIDLSTAWPHILRKFKKHNVKAETVAEIYQLYNSVNSLKLAMAHAKRRLYNALPKKHQIARSPLLHKKDYILGLFGSFHTPHQVLKILKEQGYNLQLKAVQQFAYKHNEKIKGLQAQKVENKTSLRLGNEASQIELLSDYHFYYHQKWLQSKSDKDLKNCMHCIDLASRILKTNKINVTIDGKIDLNASVHGEKVTQKAIESINIMSWIISAAATKIGINSRIMLDELSKSYYRSVSGIFEQPLQIEEAKEILVYPSQIINDLDWKALDKKYESPERLKRLDEIKLKETTPTLSKQKETETNEKAKILKHLLSQKKEQQNRL